MKRTISIRESDGLVMGTGICSGGKVVDVDEVTINGQDIPEDYTKLVGSTLSGEGPYTHVKAVKAVKPEHADLKALNSNGLNGVQKIIVDFLKSITE